MLPEERMKLFYREWGYFEMAPFTAICNPEQLIPTIYYTIPKFQVVTAIYETKGRVAGKLKFKAKEDFLLEGFIAYQENMTHPFFVEVLPSSIMLKIGDEHEFSFNSPFRT